MFPSSLYPLDDTFAFKLTQIKIAARFIVVGKSVDVDKFFSEANRHIDNAIDLMQDLVAIDTLEACDLVLELADFIRSAVDEKRNLIAFLEGGAFTTRSDVGFIYGRGYIISSE